MSSLHSLRKAMPIKYCPKSALFLEIDSNVPGGRGVWYARVPVEDTIEDVLKPEYFGQTQTESGAGRCLHVGDLIEIEPENACWRLQARVMGLRFNTGPGVPRQAFLREQQRWNYAVKAPPGYRLVWGRTAFLSGHGGWSIWKGETEVDAGLFTEEECLVRIEERRRDNRLRAEELKEPKPDKATS